MPHLLCPCGNLYEAPPGPAACPVCHQPHPLTMEKIRVDCECGAKLKVPPRLAGRTAACPKCGAGLQIPEAPSADIVTAADVVSPPPPPVTGVRKWLPLVFTLSLIPLVMTLFQPQDDTLDRLKKTLESAPEVAAQVSAGKFETESDFFSALPDNRIQGAFLPKNTWTHWIFAAVAAAGLWIAILVLFPLGNARSPDLWKVGIFTGTLGILMLIGIQYVAEWTQGLVIVGRGILTVLFYVLKFIGWSYRVALDQEYGLVMSMVGFTFGVGLCEELCKALPLIRHFRKKATLDLRGAVAWGLATGIGFGISEGIMYSSDYYNGVTTGGIYLVRFLSCTALHAVWSASTAVFIYRRQQELRDVESWFGWGLPVLKILAVSMVLHGLYDTLLKREYEAWAVLTAVASFGWFVWWVRHSAALEEPEPAPSAQPA